MMMGPANVEVDGIPGYYNGVHAHRKIIELLDDYPNYYNFTEIEDKDGYLTVKPLWGKATYRAYIEEDDFDEEQWLKIGSHYLNQYRIDKGRVKELMSDIG